MCAFNCLHVQFELCHQIFNFLSMVSLCLIELVLELPLDFLVVLLFEV